MGDHWLRGTGVATLLALASWSGSVRAEDTDAPQARAEAVQLKKWSAVAKRQGLQLQLMSANGQTMRYVSQHPETEGDDLDYVDYRLTGVTPDHRFFTLHATFYESESVYWVSRATGQQVEVFAPPDISPNGRWAVTALHTESFGPGGVFIWEIVGDSLVQRGHIEPDNGYGLFTFQRWTASDTADLERFSHADAKFCPMSQFMTATVHLVRRPGGWALTGPTSSREVRCE